MAARTNVKTSSCITSSLFHVSLHKAFSVNFRRQIHYNTEELRIIFEKSSFLTKKRSLIKFVWTNKIYSSKAHFLTVKSINLNYRAGKNTKVGTPTLPEAMERAVGLMAPDRHVANRVIILVSAVYRSTDIQSVKGRI